MKATVTVSLAIEGKDTDMLVEALKSRDPYEIVNVFSGIDDGEVSAEISNVSVDRMTTAG